MASGTALPAGDVRNEADGCLHALQEHWCVHWLEGLTIYTHTTEDRTTAVALLGELLESDRPCAEALASMRAAAVLAETTEALTGDLRDRRDSSKSKKVQKTHIKTPLESCLSDDLAPCQPSSFRTKSKHASAGCAIIFFLQSPARPEVQLQMQPGPWHQCRCQGPSGSNLSAWDNDEW